jgi:hypothetical protein
VNLEFNGNLTLRNSHIKKLDYYLNYELSTSSLFLLILVNVAFLPIIFLAAVIFTPYLLFVLIKERKYGWIITFFLMVVLPFTAIQFFVSGAAASLLSSIILGMFYIYCFLLKMTTRDWVSSENARNELAYKRKLKKVQDDIFNNRFNPPL